MRILNIAMNAPFTEGYSYQDNLLPEYQQKLGHTVTVLTGIVTRNPDGVKVTTTPCDKIMSNGVRLIRIRPFNKALAIIGYNPRISLIINKIKPDLIFIHGLCCFTPIQAIKYKRNHPNTILVADNHHDKNIFKFNKFPFSSLLKIWKSGWKRWSKHFNHIYGTTSWRRDFAIDYYGVPREKTDVLLLGVDTDNLSVDVDRIRSEIRHELHIEDNEFVFIHGGKMDTGKKTLKVIQSFSELSNPNARLILFGSVGSDIKLHFDQLVAKDSRIRYLNYIKSKLIHKYFYASDFALFPGQHSVLWEEAIGCGLPGLFKSYGNEDHTNICGNSISMSPDADVNDIYDIINNILNSKELYSEMKENALKASRHLSYYEIAKKSIEV